MLPQFTIKTKRLLFQNLEDRVDMQKRNVCLEGKVRADTQILVINFGLIMKFVDYLSYKNNYYN